MLTIKEIKAKLYKPTNKNNYFFEKIDKNTIKLIIYNTKEVNNMHAWNLNKYFKVENRQEYYPYKDIYIIRRF